MRRRRFLCVAASVAAWGSRGRTAHAAVVEDVIAEVRRSIVAVGTLQRTRSPAFRFLGTGFAVKNGAHVATNAHVLDAAKSLSRDEQIVVLLPGPPGGRQAAVTFREARRAEEDGPHDLALLAIDGPPLPALKLGVSVDVREGRTVYFTGFPIGAVLGPVPVTHRAIVAAVTPIALPRGNAAHLNAATIRRLDEGTFPVYQLDGTAYPGNSGSPVYDAETGQVVAILNMVLVKATKESMLAQPSGIAYAVPVEHLARLLGEAR